MKTVGPKYGRHLPQIKDALAALDGTAAKAELDQNGSLSLTLSDGTEVSLSTEDILIETEQKEGYYTVSDNGVTVALDCTLTPQLIEEGTVRELISKIQTMRKEKNAGFEVTDHIVLSVTDTSDELCQVVKKNLSEIQSEVLADRVVFDTPVGTPKTWDINGANVTLGIEKLGAQN